jgi:hypothetical protein
VGYRTGFIRVIPPQETELPESSVNETAGKPAERYEAVSGRTGGEPFENSAQAQAGERPANHNENKETTECEQPAPKVIVSELSFHVGFRRQV